MKDFVGNEITVGCEIVYPVRSGSSMYMRKGTVTAIHTGNKLSMRVPIEKWKPTYENGKYVRGYYEHSTRVVPFYSPDRCVVIGFPPQPLPDAATKAFGELFDANNEKQIRAECLSSSPVFNALKTLVHESNRIDDNIQRGFSKGANYVIVNAPQQKENNAVNEKPYHALKHAIRLGEVVNSMESFIRVAKKVADELDLTIDPDDAGAIELLEEFDSELQDLEIRLKAQ